jgi:hypothetical protein
MTQFYIIICVVIIIGLIILANLYFTKKPIDVVEHPALCSKGAYSVTGNTPCMTCPENAVCENDGTSLLNITCKPYYTKYVTIAGVISCVDENNNTAY